MKAGQTLEKITIQACRLMDKIVMKLSDFALNVLPVLVVTMMVIVFVFHFSTFLITLLLK